MQQTIAKEDLINLIRFYREHKERKRTNIQQISIQRILGRRNHHA